MKKTAAIFTILFLIGTALPQSMDWFEGSFEEAKAKSESEKKPILIDFFSQSG